MPAAADEFAEHCAELLSVAGTVRRRRMFGGHGLYVDGRFVAIIAFGRLYLKGSEPTAARFEAAGGERFTYEAAGRRTRLTYWTVPDEAMESPSAMRPWVQLALQAARAAAPAARRPRPVPRPR